MRTGERERESCVVALSETNTKEVGWEHEKKNFFDIDSAKLRFWI